MTFYLYFFHNISLSCFMVFFWKKKLFWEKKDLTHRKQEYLTKNVKQFFSLTTLEENV